MKMMALEEFSSDRATLSQTMHRVQVGQAVCRADVEPYIQHFPMQFSLGSFTEEPSQKNLEVALEGFAALLKETAADNLSGIVGICVGSFTQARKFKEAATVTAEHVLEGIKTLLSTQALIITAPGYQIKAGATVGGGALSSATGGRFKGELNFAAFAGEFYSDQQCHDLSVASEGIAAAIAYGEFPGVTGTLAQPLTDYLGDLSKRLDEVRTAVQSATKRLNNGDLRGGARAFERIDLIGPRGYFLSIFNKAYDSLLSSPKSIQSPNSATLLDDRVKALTALFNASTRQFKGRSKAQGKAIDDWRSGTIVESFTRLHGAAMGLSGADNTKTGRLAKMLARECEDLKRKVSATEFTAEAEVACKAILEEIRLDAVSAAGLFELMGLEQRLVGGYVSAFLRKQAALASAVALFTGSSDSSLARKLEAAGKLGLKLSSRSL